MMSTSNPAEPTVVRRLFTAWSIEIPASFAETMVDGDAYWHAYDDRRSVSLTSVVLTGRGRPVAVDEIAKRIPALDGSPIAELPPGLVGRAAVIRTTQPAPASQALSGALVAEGRILLVTVTADDLAWARRVWMSIRAHAAPMPSRRDRRARKGGRRVH
jgi:hypothetical protein